MITMPQTCSGLEHAFLRCSILALSLLGATAWVLPCDVNMISGRDKFDKNLFHFQMSDPENPLNHKGPIEISTRD